MDYLVKSQANMLLNAIGCKQDAMSQHPYFKQGLHILLPKVDFFIQLNLCAKSFATFYEKCL